ncbi:hypothetical protein F503_04671 [Ophiostoma piceae UAMH 11346]|uniref:Protein kinase domain-containing protein n=1 Tax=Ophiostoma piceae (strain UAMH 11346) TaxID=1262450 RepID=S3BXH1_OPHP1|nr:hypothetical protein F503_04671 [Ophiostoma piceae UAMH 11346]
MRSHYGMAIPSPYRVGATVQLHIHESFSELTAPGTVAATIAEVFSMTMQPVMRVTIPTSFGTDLSAVLKVYDRRCGSILREANEVVPHTEELEAAYQSFVRSGEAELFVRSIKETERVTGDRPSADDYLDDKDDSGPYSPERFETALWLDSNEYFDTESRTYAHLRDLQGHSIPQLYALASLDLSGGGAYGPARDLCSGPLSVYFQTKAILLEYIPGPTLSDFPSSELSTCSGDPRQTVQTVVREAVEIVHEINRRGVLLRDCSPSNAVVDQRTLRAKLIDLTHSVFRQDKIDYDINVAHDNEEPGWDPDLAYWDYAFCMNSTEAIGAVMTGKCRREKGMALTIGYPDRDKIREDIKNKVCRWEEGGYILQKHPLKDPATRPPPVKSDAHGR